MSMWASSNGSLFVTGTRGRAMLSAACGPWNVISGYTSGGSTMSTIAATSRSSELEPLRATSGWIVALGVIYLITGIIALGSVVMATVASVFVVGIMMLIAGIAEVINAFQVKSW